MQRIAERLCTDRGEHDDHRLYTGFVGGDIDGYQWAALITGRDDLLTAETDDAPIRTLPGDEWPYLVYAASDSERAVVEYCEGDVAVWIYESDEAYRQALARYAEGAT